MAIDVRAISITGAFNAIKSFFQSQENNSRWKDFTTGSEGSFLIRLLANVIRVISQNTVTGRREVFQDTANLVSSNIGIGVTNGSYPTYRGRNQRRLINFTPNDNMTIPKFTQLGTYSGDYGLYTLEDLTFVKGEAQEFSVVIGTLREVTWTANTTSLTKFARFEQDISEDVDLLLDGTSLSKEDALSKYVKDMIYDKYCILTNPWKSVTIMYLNNAEGASHKYSADTEFTLRYIELEDIESIDFTEEMFLNYGTLNNVLIIENYIPFEDVASIKANAPVHRETQSLVRSKKDFADLVNEFVPAINQTNYKALTPTYTAVTYMKRDYTYLEENEYESLVEQLEPCMAFGRPLPDIVNPLEEVTTLDVTIGATNRYIDEASITEDVQSIVDTNYANMLASSFDKYELENLYNQLNYCKYSRVNIHIGEREPYTTQKIGDFISTNDMTYKCTGILGETGINEPEWNIPDDDTAVENIYTGLETTDNKIVWACYKRLDIDNIQVWKASKRFCLGEFAYSDSIPQYMFKVVDIVKNTDIDEPDVAGIDVGEYVQDGDMVLLCITYNDAYDDRINNHQYRLGDKFNCGGLSFQYVGMTGKTSTSEALTFNDAEYSLFVLTGTDFDRAVQLDGQVCLYINDTSVADVVNPQDVLRINLVEQVDKEWEEVPDDELIMKSKITAKVKEYEDTEDTSSGEDNGSSTTTNVTVTVINYYTGNTIPNIEDVNMGDSIADGDFTITRVPYSDTYPERISSYSYNNNDHFNISVYNNDNELLYSYSFVVVAPVVEKETSDTEDTGDTDTEPGIVEPDETEENANWKELEKYLALQDEVQEWIVSEDSDKLKCPADVIQFFYEVGRITSEERTILTEYYNQYDEYDEHQIYMYMDSMGATRREAIEMLTRTDSDHEHCKQLKDPISDAHCVRQYLVNEDGDDEEDSTLVYIDKYSDDFVITTSAVTGSEDTYSAFTVTRIDADLVTRAVRTYIYKDEHTIVLYSEQINNDTESVSRLYLVTAREARVVARDVNGSVRDLTRITPATAIAQYSEGYVNISFTKTDDGEIRWEQVEDTDTIQYGWNVFANYDINLEVKY